MKRLKDNSDAPEARLGTLPKTFKGLKTKLHSTFPRRNEYSRPRQQKSRRKERLWWISEACMHMVSKRDLNSAELETMRTSRSPTTVMTANGEVQTREEATVHVKELDFFVTVMLLEVTPTVLSLSGSSVRIMGIPSTGPAVKKHISPKRATELIAISQTMCHS